MKAVRSFLGCAALLAISLSAPLARGANDKLYRCTSKDAVSIKQDATLDKLLGKSALEQLDKVTFDISNGDITFPSSGKRDVWTVEKTTLGNDYVLFPRGGSRSGRSVADGVTTFIHLHLVPNEQPLFMAFALSYLVTGTCERR